MLVSNTWLGEHTSVYNKACAIFYALLRNYFSNVSICVVVVVRPLHVFFSLFWETFAFTLSCFFDFKCFWKLLRIRRVMNWLKSRPKASVSLSYPLSLVFFSHTAYYVADIKGPVVQE